MEEIKVGEYVRTTNKGIRQIAMIDNHKTVNKYLYFTGIEDFEGKEYGIIKTTEIVKHSEQLIDLIGCGDIVNRHLVIDKYEDTDEYGNDFWCLIIEDNSLLNRSIREENIKTILTKESYMTNCYQVGGENE